MLQELFDKYSVSNFFAYHENQRDKSTVEFGWIPVAEITSEVSMVISTRDDETKNNAATLEDYRVYFERLTLLTPDEFIQKWKPSLRELEVYWNNRFPESDSDQHKFIMSLAYLIRDHTEFEMYGATYRVFVPVA